MTLPKKLAHLKIPLDDIQSATDNFADEYLIREGGFGRIYRGKLTRFGKTIDIVARRFDTKYWRGSKEFWTEILMLYSLKDQKLVSLVGFCEENDEKIIVNKHEANGSLDKYLSDPAFTWTRRLQVCLDVALALRYIHYNKQRNFSVIHSNLKSSNILLDEKWEAKISGFELSKINPVARRHGLVLDKFISGTYAYVDPAYVKNGGVTHKSDAYALGVILFEVMCGKKAFIRYKDDGFSPPLAKPLSMERKLQEVVNDKGHAPTMTKPHSNEGILDDVKRDGHSTRLPNSQSNQGILDENVINEGSSTQLGKQLSNEGELQVLVNDEAHAPLLTKPHSNEGKVGVVAKVDGIFQNEEHIATLYCSASVMGDLDYETRSHSPTIKGGVANTSFIGTEYPTVWEADLHMWEPDMDMRQPSSFSTFQPGCNSITSFTDIQQLMVAPSFTDIYAPTFSGLERPNISFSKEEYCDNDSYAALYMTTFRNLKHLKVSKEGLLSQLAKSHYEAGNLDDIIHPGLRVQMDSQSLKIFSEAAYCCLKEKRAQRPDIDRIISALKKALERQQNSILKIVAAKGTTSISHLEACEDDALSKLFFDFCHRLRRVMAKNNTMILNMEALGHHMDMEALGHHMDFEHGKKQHDDFEYIRVFYVILYASSYM